MWMLHHPKHQGTSHLKSELASYAWPHMEISVEKFLSSCICAEQKSRAGRAPALPKAVVPKVSYPLQLVSVDLYSYKGQLYLTAVDHFSGFPVAYAAEDKTKEIFQATILWSYMSYTMEC